MATKHSLARLYQSRFPGFSSDHSILASFFSETLKIPNCGWEDLISEIRHFKSSEFNDLDRISMLYKALLEMDPIGVSGENMRQVQAGEQNTEFRL